MNNNGSDNSDGKQKPTLTLSLGGKLGLQSNVTDAAVRVKPQAVGRSGTIVEVKRRRGARSIELAENQELSYENDVLLGEKGSLTLREQESRIKALKIRHEQQAIKEATDLLMKTSEKDSLVTESTNISEELKNDEILKAASYQDEDVSLKSGLNDNLIVESLEIRGQTGQDGLVNSSFDLENVYNESGSESKKDKKNEKRLEEIVEKEEKSSSKKPASQQKTAYEKHVKLAVREALSSDGEDDDSEVGVFSAEKAIVNKRVKQKKKSAKIKREKLLRKVTIPQKITVQDLAAKMAEKAKDVINVLSKDGHAYKLTDFLDSDTACYLVERFGHTFEIEKDRHYVLEATDVGVELMPRPPVVTIMGHVDHGKTSLLDAIRKANIVESEFGGITQHIGAYQVTKNDKLITFIDTPGHEAFTSMRARGANVTDIVVLVVAVDDGVMAQTIEAINHVKAAGVPVIVAVNKIDKPKSDITKIRDTLLRHGIIAEELGGDVIMVPVSAKERINLEKLEDAILLVAEFLELKSPINCKASGVVIESQIDKNRGVLATVIVQKGTLKVGDIVVAGYNSYGKVRAMINDKGSRETKALPATPIEILGLSEVPMAGDNFVVVDSEKQARELINYRIQAKSQSATQEKKIDIDDIFATAENKEELNVILKCDVVGSLEAIYDSMCKFNHEDLKLNVLHKAAGNITDSDVLLAEASNAVILGFNVSADNKVKELVKQKSVDMRFYTIIYELLDDVKDMLSGLLKPVIKEVHSGTMSVKEIFALTRQGAVIGGQVSFGAIKRGSVLKLFRGEKLIFEGKLKTLRRFKDDVKEVKSGFECGVMLDSCKDVKAGDTIKTFDLVEEIRTLS